MLSWRSILTFAANSNYISLCLYILLCSEIFVSRNHFHVFPKRYMTFALNEVLLSYLWVFYSFKAATVSNWIWKTVKSVKQGLRILIYNCHLTQQKYFSPQSFTSRNSCCKRSIHFITMFWFQISFVFSF